MELIGRAQLDLQRDTSACYVCGPKNSVGLHVPFTRDGERGARGEYVARAEHCGWPGMLHGGVTFALMDEALAYALYFQQLCGVTARAEMRCPPVRFRSLPDGARETVPGTVSRPTFVFLVNFVVKSEREGKCVKNLFRVRRRKSGEQR